jgi:hypothetical protein
MFKLKLKLEKPTIIAAIAYLIMAVIVVMPMNIGDYDPNYVKTKKFDLGYRILLLVILLIPIGISLYSINCMVAGKCMVWSYINSVIICLWVILFLVASLISTQKSETI